jgi:hypothetical protein
MACQVHEFTEQVCSRCKTVKAGAAVWVHRGNEIGNHYIYVECPICGVTVIDINASNNPIPEEIEQGVIDAVQRAKEGIPEPDDKEPGDPEPGDNPEMEL